MLRNHRDRGELVMKMEERSSSSRIAVVNVRAAVASTKPKTQTRQHQSILWNNFPRFCSREKKRRGKNAHVHFVGFGEVHGALF